MGTAVALTLLSPSGTFPAHAKPFPQNLTALKSLSLHCPGEDKEVVLPGGTEELV